MFDLNLYCCCYKQPVKTKFQPVDFLQTILIVLIVWFPWLLLLWLLLKLHSYPIFVKIFCQTIHPLLFKPLILTRIRPQSNLLVHPTIKWTRKNIALKRRDEMVDTLFMPFIITIFPNMSHKCSDLFMQNPLLHPMNAPNYLYKIPYYMI